MIGIITQGSSCYEWNHGCLLNFLKPCPRSPHRIWGGVKQHYWVRFLTWYERIMPIKALDQFWGMILLWPYHVPKAHSKYVKEVLAGRSLSSLQGTRGFGNQHQISSDGQIVPKLKWGRSEERSWLWKVEDSNKNRNLESYQNWLGLCRWSKEPLLYMLGDWLWLFVLLGIILVEKFIIFANAWI